MATKNTSSPGDESPSDRPSSEHFQSTINFNDPRENEREGYSPGLDLATPQDETAQQRNGQSSQDTAGNASRVVYIKGGVGLTEREAIESQVREVNKLIDREQAQHKSEIRELKAKISDAEERYTRASEELVKTMAHQRDTDKLLLAEREWLHTKDQELFAKEKELKTQSKAQGAKEQELKEREHELEKKKCELNNLLAHLKTEIEKIKEEKLKAENTYQQHIKKLEAKGAQLQADLKKEVSKSISESLSNLRKSTFLPHNVITSTSNNGHMESTPHAETTLPPATTSPPVTISQAATTPPTPPVEIIPPPEAMRPPVPPEAPGQEDSVSIPAKEATFSKSRELGTGAFGKVYEGRFDGRPCAVKILNDVAMLLCADLPLSDGKIQRKAKRSFEREGDCLIQLNHRNVVKLYDIRVYPEAGYPVLIMEKLDSTLTEFLRSSQGTLRPAIQLSFSCDIASALQYLQERGIIHRDLCSDNILLDTKSTDIPVAKVSDFGMSKILNFEKMSATLTSIDGHRVAYYPPEMRDDPKAYDQSIDVFMFGIVMTQIACRRPEIDSVRVRRELISEISESNVMKKHIKCCVQEEQNKRPSAKELHSALRKEYENSQEKSQ